MAFFSERNGFIDVSKTFIKNEVPEAVANAMCSSFEEVCNILNKYGKYDSVKGSPSKRFELYICTHFLNKRKSQLSSYKASIESFVVSTTSEWYKKLDFIEFVLENLRETSKSAYDFFVKDLNWQFSRLNYGYIIVADKVVERITDNEIKSIETAINNGTSSAGEHFAHALELYSQRPEGDYANSIKESISAVECVCRGRTEVKTLGDALDTFEKKGIHIHPRLKAAFEQMYAYTNQPDTGIRHAMMDNVGTYAPGPEEALFFLITSSAFVNYINSK